MKPSDQALQRASLVLYERAGAEKDEDPELRQVAVWLRTQMTDAANEHALLGALMRAVKKTRASRAKTCEHLFGHSQIDSARMCLLCGFRPVDR
jgi:hypothetical protein